MVLTDSVIKTVQKYISNPSNSCIEYPILNKDGYGVIQPRINGKKVHYLVHRVAYQIYYGDNLNPNNLICHKCDNPKCINPLHLFKGTNLDNSNDKVAKGRQAKGKTHGKYIDGRASDMEFHHTRKYGDLSISQVLEVRELKKKGEKLINIANMLNIPYQTVRDISCDRVYKDIK